MEQKEYNKLTEAMDLVCLNCIVMNATNCDKCPVRKNYDYYYKQQNEKNKYVTMFAITEKNMYGKFIGESYLYRYIGDGKPSTEIFKDIIFQCCEIERIYDNELFVEVQTTYNGGYVDSDEYIVKVKISLTKNLSKYIKWEQCPSLPPIYQVNKEQSNIDIELN